MAEFRNRPEQAVCEFILGLTLSAGLATKTVAESSLAIANVDNILQVCIEQARRVTGVTPDEAYADRYCKENGFHRCVHPLPRPLFNQDHLKGDDEN